MRHTITPQWVHAHTPALIPIRRHLPIEYAETTTISIHIRMPKQAVILRRTMHGFEVITDTLRCIKLRQSEYEAHLFLHEHRNSYKLVNTTSKTGKAIVERLHSQEILGTRQEISPAPRGWDHV